MVPEQLKKTTISQSRAKKYVSNPPIFLTIPLTHVIVDNLHMFRVADTLIDLLILELHRLDKVEKATNIKSLDRLFYLKKYENTIKMLGVTGFSFWTGKESKQLKCRSLTGPEKLIVFRKINIVETFPEVPHSADVHALWKKLLEILCSQYAQNKSQMTKSQNSVPSLLNLYIHSPTSILQSMLHRTCTAWHSMLENL